MVPKQQDSATYYRAFASLRELFLLFGDRIIGIEFLDIICKKI
jgi:hypothetical protein